MNPLQNVLGSPQTAPNNAGIKQCLDAVRMAQNPSKALTEMFQRNPALASIAQMCQGRDPKDVFYQECQRRGVNPEDIINQLK